MKLQMVESTEHSVLENDLENGSMTEGYGF